MLLVYGKRRWLRAMVCILVFFALCELGLMATVAATARTMDAPAPSDVMIVLGGGLDPRTGEPRATLAYRLDRALELYGQGYATKVIVSGGKGADEPISEAQSMRNYLIARGMPGEAILMEDQSTDTAENMRNSRRIMDVHGCSDALIVTSDYHLWRALSIARDAGIPATGAASRNSSTLLFSLKNIARETISWIKYMIFR